MTPEQFRTTRHALGHTQYSVAEALGMTGRWSFQTISEWERGVKPIPVKVGLAMERLLAKDQPR